MSIFDRFPLDSGTGVLLSDFPSEPKPMTRECAEQILAAVKRYGPKVMRPEYVEEAKDVLGHSTAVPSNPGA